METNKLKKFAIDARNRLKTGVAAKMLTLGFDRNGNVPEHMRPQLMQGGSLWNGQLQTESFYHQWNALYQRINQKGIREVYEEVAYTWFNRLVAIRILQKNGIIEPVLEYVDAARTPRIVDEARMGRMPQMQEALRTRLLELLEDDSRITEQFAVLIAAFCHDNPMLNACFGRLDDYTELLLPNDILTEGGFVDMLNHTEFITDADFRSPELIGWLYQFYISERKDEVFAKKGKFSADEIPAATQIFTPNWIVKYMVQNTIGRIYLDNHPSAATEFKPKWKYLVEPSSPTPKEAIYKFKELTELLVGDLACGSGHILNECFDLLYDLYIYEGYSRREAVKYIFTHNLRGVDLDTRAKQLSQFALLLKACQKDHSFADTHVLPKVLDMPKNKDYRLSDLSEFMQTALSDKSVVELSKAFELMKDADSLGSIMKFDISETTKMAITQAMDYWHNQSFIHEQVKKIVPAMDLIQTLTDNYAVLVMNPPYMGSSNMNQELSEYVKRFYPEGKADLMTVFMQVAVELTKKNGIWSMINLPSWMFLNSFDDFRKKLVKEQHILSMLHLGRGIFGSDFGSVSFVIQNCVFDGKGCYKRLFDKHVEVRSIEKIQELFFNKTNSTFYANQKDYEKIPGIPIGYWVTQQFLQTFSAGISISSISDYTGSQHKTADNDKYLRLLWEVDDRKINYKKWIFYAKGGPARKWYGNIDLVVDWSEEARNFYLTNPTSNMIKETYWYKEGITYTSLSSSANYFRFLPGIGVFDIKGPSIVKVQELYYCLGFFNTKLARRYFDLLNPTITLQVKDVKGTPIIISKNFEYKNSVDMLTKECVNISKKDWDSHETSWDFETNPLVAMRESLIKDEDFRVATVYDEEDVRFDVDKDNETAIKMHFANNLETLANLFKQEWEERFMHLHHNEEELNRQFIEIYGLQDELSPEVPLDETTILQQGEISISDNKLKWNEDVLMKQLISYAVGVWVGRYKLGKKGLHIAHPEPTDQELQEYWYGGEQVFIDDDALIPILPQNSPFDDNLSSRIADFIRIVFGAETLTENLNYIEKMLGTTIDQYVQKDFWKDHKKMYQNRPIYWLFSSKKGAFKCLAYMHRMDPYTAERVRSNYLLPYIEYLQNQIGDLESRAAALTTAENRKLTNLRKALDECQEYHERLQVVAEQAIDFDLDDGVIVNYAKFGDILAKIK